MNFIQMFYFYLFKREREKTQPLVHSSKSRSSLLWDKSKSGTGNSIQTFHRRQGQSWCAITQAWVFQHGPRILPEAPTGPCQSAWSQFRFSFLSSSLLGLRQHLFQAWLVAFLVARNRGAALSCLAPVSASVLNVSSMPRIMPDSEQDPHSKSHEL